MKTDKPLVLAKAGVDFSLPEGHVLAFSKDAKRLSLYAPKGGGGIYEISAIHDDDSKIRVVVGRITLAVRAALPLTHIPSRVETRLKNVFVERGFDSGGDPLGPIAGTETTIGTATRASFGSAFVP